MSNSTTILEESNETKVNKTLDCGIIMPIAGMTGYSESHWTKVKNIIIEATAQVKGYDFKTKIVSESDGEINVIHKRIIQNLYNSEIVICDISGKNPNVLFELGMRLAFDKPTILIKDDNTDFIFDTGVIEHIAYPKSLSYPEIVEFKKELATRIKTTYEKMKNDPSYSTFLRNFGTFKITQLDQEEVKISNESSLILEELKRIQNNVSISNIEKRNKSSRPFIPSNLKSIIQEYINDTGDYESPNVIQYKEEFIKYLANKGIQINAFKIPDNVLIKYINDAQDVNLPF